ncbi:molecular chaperone GrpE [endosymbiont of Euscepes postfasciatus]|uniref:nucleotide exchange factor GrpE n=1 Tax=endosymbiont of Euscepes postfasciatus TaxID=650377 RepID=UPI000DC6F0D8|nr:nucleotide exchange factor GrpE [endosymbiont of Euscepes postfasciatus]BBA84745.1 molecular chaperone GrpE [endosymbiont of Euscepes postfasciatus]
MFEKDINDKNDNINNDIINNENNDINSCDKCKSIILDLEKKIDENEKEYFDKILRLNAELENIDKRSKIEIDKIYKFSLEKFFTEFLEVIDNLERTEKELENDKIDINIIKEGIILTLKMLIQITNKFGLIVIDKINVIFDPNIHQAILTIKNESLEDNLVTEIIQKGYILNNRLIRPAMVKVSKK